MIILTHFVVIQCKGGVLMSKKVYSSFAEEVADMKAYAKKLHIRDAVLSGVLFVGLFVYTVLMYI